MQRLTELQDRIASMGELQDIVSAMRSLAGMRVQEAQQALPGIRRYAESMAAAIGAALMLMARQEPAPQGRQGIRVLILCTSEHGFVAGFNERLIEAAEAEIKTRDVLFALGSRGAALALERGLQPAWASPMASRLAGAPDTVNQLTRELYSRIAQGEISRVEVMFSRYRQGVQSTIERRLLLPLDTASLAAAQPRQEPLHNLEPAALFEKLAAEYVFALLTEAAVESIASENAARFSAMEAACDNVQKKLEQLQQDASQARQIEITSELLDLVTGAEALSGT
ncbi:MAG: F0F1 ATP synthase subunit gamma [Rhodomicrobium sp.]